MSRPRDPNMST